MNQIAIVLDGQVISAPQVQEEITGGAVAITSSETTRDWEALASALNEAAQG